MRRRLRLGPPAGALLASALLAGGLLAGGPAVAAPSFPAPTGFLVDSAHALPETTRVSVEAELEDYSRRTGNQVAVAVVSGLEGASVEDYAHDLFAHWGIGLRGKDNGVLLLIAVGDRKDRIEVGRGLEGDLTDLTSASILRTAVTPAAAAGDLGAAVQAGERAIRRTLGDPQADVAVGPSSTSAGDPFGGGIPRERPVRHQRFPVGLLFLAGFFVVAVLSRRRRGRRGGGGGYRRQGGFGAGFVPGLLFGALLGEGRGGGYGGGGFGGGGGGFGGFGGGGSGGGGASGGW